jgi:transglutaminase-like putative cysteine protease
MSLLAPSIPSVESPPAFDSIRERWGFTRLFSPFWRAIVIWQIAVAFLSVYVSGEGELHPLSASIFLPALFGAFLFARSSIRIPSWAINAVTILVLAILVWVGRSAFFSSLLYLLGYLSLVKIYSLRSPRDYAQVQALGFFMILSSAVISVSLSFAFFFLAYLTLATLGLLLYGMSRQGAWALLPEIGGSRASQLVPKRLFGSAWCSGFLLLVLAFGFFYLLPHYSFQRIDAPMSSQSIEEEPVSGFSEDVELGSFKRLAPDMTHVMSVGLSFNDGADASRPNHLRLRGVVLDSFSDNRWSKFDPPRVQGLALNRAPGLQRLVDSLDLRVPTGVRGRNTNLEIHQDPRITLRIFGASYPREVRFRNRNRHEVRADERTATAQVVGFGGSRENPYTDRFIYSVQSNMIEESTRLLGAWIRDRDERRNELAEQLRLKREPGGLLEIQRRQAELGRRNEPLLPWLSPAPGPRLPPSEAVIDTQLPSSPVIDRIVEASRQFAPGPTDAQIVLQTVDFIRRNFTYSIEPDTPPGVDPIEAFFFETRKGHCEFYSTVVAIVLRGRGIPARLVNGYYTTEWNRLAQVFMIKQIDAHSWNEVWLEGLGWVTIDATPPDSAGRGAYDTSGASLTSTWWEYLRLEWERRIIDYSLDRQIALFTRVSSGGPAANFWAGVNRLRSRLGASREGAAAADDAPALLSKWGPLVDLALLIALLACAAALVILARRRLPGRLARANVDYFDALMRRLARFGRRRPVGRTPMEFARSLADDGWAAEELIWLVRLYYRHRFAGVAPSSAERRRAFDLARSILPPEARKA